MPTSVAVPPQRPSRNIIILGASYGGLRAARVLAEGLKDMGLSNEYRIVLIERNSHFNHLYALPRFSVLPGHEHKPFIPYQRIFDADSRNVVLHAMVQKMTKSTVTFSYNTESSSNKRSDKVLHSGTAVMPFAFLIYALGATLPDPINLWRALDVDLKAVRCKDCTCNASISIVTDGTKPASKFWLCQAQRNMATAKSFLIVGGGALGIQLATDLAVVHPTHNITLLHSGARLLPKFDPRMHDIILEKLSNLNINVVLGERVDLESLRKVMKHIDGEQIVRTQSGRVFRADTVLLCTGQTANSSIMSDGLGKDVVNQHTKMIHVTRSLQVFKGLPSTDGKDLGGEESHDHIFENIFAIGDAADAFGAIKAGHTAYYQGEVAAKNILKLAKGGAVAPAELDQYTPGAPAIKVTLGLRDYVSQVGDNVSFSSDGSDDLEVRLMWNMLGYKDEALDMQL